MLVDGWGWFCARALKVYMCTGGSVWEEYVSVDTAGYGLTMSLPLPIGLC